MELVCKGPGEKVGLLFDTTEDEDEAIAMTGELFGKMTWCLIPEDVILDVPIVFFTLLGFGRMLVTVIFPDDFLVEIGLFIVVVIEIVKGDSQRFGQQYGR